MYLYLSLAVSFISKNDSINTHDISNACILVKKSFAFVAVILFSFFFFLNVPLAIMYRYQIDLLLETVLLLESLDKLDVLMLSSLGIHSLDSLPGLELLLALYIAHRVSAA